VNRENRMSEVAPVEIRRMWLYYRGIGRVAFEYQRDVGWHQIQFIADPMAFEMLMPYRAANAASLPDDASIAMIQLMSGNSSSIKASAMAMFRRDDVPLEYLDTAAELLLTRHVEAARAGAGDTYSWLCNVLAHHGGPRYAQVLASVERETSDPKLKKFAAQPIDKSQLKERMAYLPGSVSLAEKARQYPSLYPQITLVRGQL
jgi:hypothetical protein